MVPMEGEMSPSSFRFKINQNADKDDDKAGDKDYQRDFFDDKVFIVDEPRDYVVEYHNYLIFIIIGQWSECFASGNMAASSRLSFRASVMMW